jgi:hypothetical protein
MSRTFALGGIALIVAITVTAVVSQSLSGPRFPHEDHARLFPLCIGCHEGIETGDVTEFYPDPALCGQCHDGTRQEPVEWDGPARPLTNLTFSHPQHDEVADRPIQCAECHSPEGAPRMAVETAIPDRCFDCHEAHPATDHFVDAQCTTCHVPLAESGFGLARVLELPEPETHRSPAFLADLHGDLADRDPTRCSTCHVRELCTSCHVDAQRVGSIAQIPAGRGAIPLPAFVARYPVPDSHLRPDWEVRHGDVSSVAECSTCHTRDGCLTCHQEPASRATRTIAQLPARRAVEAPGVVLARRAPESHASPWFATRHGEVAVTRRETCSTCHARTNLCVACHAPVAAAPAQERPTLGLDRAEPREVVFASVVPFLPSWAPPARADTVPAAAAPRVQVPAEVPQTTAQRQRRPRTAEFHPPGFTTRHSSAAYSRRLDCAQCHNTRVFCRDCHTESGFQSRGRLGQGFHDAEPIWLLRHGQAARQTLESCTTCHAQQDCMQCHSQLGAFRVNPHRTGFDARRAQKRNPAVCFACHLSDPMGRSTP